MKGQWILISVLFLELLLALTAGLALAQGPTPPEQTGGPDLPAAPVSSYFTYQGFLQEGGAPANGLYDFRFNLYPSLTGGASLLGSNYLYKTGVNVVNGLFTVQLDFNSVAGKNLFTGAARYMEIAVQHAGAGSYTVLSPRQELTAAPYAFSLKPGAIISGTGCMITAYGSSDNYATIYGGDISPKGGRGVVGVSDKGTGVVGASYGSAPGVHGTGVYTGVWGESTNGPGVWGKGSPGVWGESTNGPGVWGESTGTGVFGWGNRAGVEGGSTNGIGVYGRSYSTTVSADTAAVKGENTGGGYGVYGKGGTGVIGWSTSSSGGTGVYGSGSQFGVSGASIGIGVQGASTIGTGVLGSSISGDGVKGSSVNRVGVYGTATYTGVCGVAGQAGVGVHGRAGSTGVGVFGLAGGSPYGLQPGTGVFGFGGNNYGVHGVSPLGTGVYGQSDQGTGVHGTTNFGTAVSGEATDGTGVAGRSTSGVGVWGESAAWRGVYGKSTSDVGVYGQSTSNTGVAGRSTSGVGVWGESAAWRGVYGKSTSDVGVYGQSTSNTGVAGHSTSGTGVWGESTSSRGVYGVGGTYGVVGESTGHGVHGESHDGTGVFGGSVNGFGVYGTSTNGVGVRAISYTGNPLEAWSIAPDNRRFYVDNVGNVYADGTWHTPAADQADMLPATGKLEPGDVLAVGPDGKLTRSMQPSQASVVGVYSTQPGFVGGAGDGTDPTGKVPLAVAGVVPVKVSAENGAIRPGDLLVASGTPGHAMRAPANPAPGTVIGKALGSLDSGTGVIQMLVMLR